MKNYIVIREGLSCSEGKVSPSYIYEQILRELKGHLLEEDVVVLAPANEFGLGISEQRAAEKYLKDLNIQNKVIVFDISAETYIDTRGNAKLLREHLKASETWPLSNAVIWSYSLHANRAAMIFQQEGFDVSTVAVQVDVQSKPIVSRLWYYNYPLIHRAYELFAHVIFFLRLK